MANEAILRDTKVLSSRRYTITEGLAIPKNSLLFLEGDNEASLAKITGGRVIEKAFLGIAHADANKDTDSSFNTETNVSADKGAIYDLVASGAIALGQLVIGCGDNKVAVASAANITSSYACIVGRALEAATSQETINVEVYV